MMNHFILYHTEDGNSKINLTLENGTIWLSQLQIAELFQTSKQTISKQIKNILEDGELDEKVVVNYLFIATEQGEMKGRLTKSKVAYYNLDMILAIGYRIQFPRGIQFRKYTSTVLKEYFIKGFAMDDERFKNLGKGNYFKGLLERIHDIRFSEKVFYRQLLDLFATSVDYTKDSGEAKKFFATVQNKLHFPIHHQTRTETGDNQGVKLVNGELPTFSDSKRHLIEKELSSGTSGLVYALQLAGQFAAGVFVILAGVRLILGEIVPAFKGISERLVPNSKPALDCPIVYPYAPNAVLIGFISSFAGGLVSMALMIATGSVVILPGVVPHFFCGATAGVIGNASGGVRGATIGAFLQGVLISFLPVFLMPVLGSLGFQGSTFSDADFGLSGIILGVLNQVGSQAGIIIGLIVVLAAMVGISLVHKAPAKEE